MTNEALVWQKVIDFVSNDTQQPPMVASQLRLAQTRGSGGGILYLAVQMPFTQNILETRYRQIILEALAKIDETGEITDFLVATDPTVNTELNTAPAENPASAAAKPAESPEFSQNSTSPAGKKTSESGGAAANPANPWQANAATEPQASTASNQPQNSAAIVSKPAATPPELNPNYTFDTFVYGQANRFAHAASLAVAEAPATIYNPLFIYGAAGLGKTHLLHAIGHYAYELNPSLRVRYTNTEEFLNEFINSIGNTTASNEFQDRYRNIDVLLIDDIQFLSGKTETQESFFHTFNTLQKNNKQVVLTSDVQPKDLAGFEERLLSRFSSGLLTDIQVPDLETRMGILRNKMQQEGLEIDNGVIEFIAQRFHSNIRELEGALIRVMAYSTINKVKIDMDIAYNVLKDLIPKENSEELEPLEIIRQTASYFKVSVDEICGMGRTQQIAKPRQIAMYLCREFTSLSLPKIGLLFGGRDHSTVLHATRKIGDLIKEDRTTYNQISDLTLGLTQTAGSLPSFGR